MFIAKGLTPPVWTSPRPPAPPRLRNKRQANTRETWRPSRESLMNLTYFNSHTQQLGRGHLFSELYFSCRTCAVHPGKTYPPRRRGGGEGVSRRAARDLDRRFSRTIQRSRPDLRVRRGGPVRHSVSPGHRLPQDVHKRHKIALKRYSRAHFVFGHGSCSSGPDQSQGHAVIRSTFIY